MIRVSAGPEDFALDAGGQRLIVGALRRPPKAEQPAKFWSIDLAGPKKHEPQKMTVSQDVFPTGITLRQPHLYATNNRPGGKPSIEVFTLGANTLTHLRSIAPADVRLRALNDVAVLKNGDLFVTDAKANKVYRVDVASNRWTLFAKLRLPNGLEVDSAERYVFVNSLLCRRMHIYDFAGTLIKTVRLPGYADNLQWEVQDSILDAALHVSFLRVVGHIAKNGIRSPSRGVRIDVGAFMTNPANGVTVKPLYDLPQFSGGSTALFHNETLYVSQVALNQIHIDP